MQGLLIAIDKVNTWVGKIFSWSILAMTFVIVYEVFSRYVLNAPTTWAYDVSYMLYGTLFIMAGPYALSRNGHVRGDFLYRKWSPRVQATVDLTLYILFFFAAVLALIYSGWGFFKISYMFNERSAFSPQGPPMWPFKMLIPLVGVLMLLQGLAESVRCVICIRKGWWPQRLQDVEELEQKILAEAAERREVGAAR
jgi:TRAP-type mannitol/chloroaromatic compound transport system permease small subunit